MWLRIWSICVFIIGTCLTRANGYAVSLAGVTSQPEGLDVIIDTDPGGDDAMAILLFLSKLSPAKVLALTVVTGNVDIVNGTRNALLILKVANRLDIPVYSGGDQGLVFKEKSDNFFGQDGFGDNFTDKPSIELKKSEHAAQALVRYVKERPGQITILCIGPLTNIAIAQQLYPKFLSNLKDLVILGGSHQGGGNVKPGVEFNIYGDPEAAAYVFSKIPPGRTATVVPLEAVKAAETTVDWRVKVLGRMNNCFVNFMNRAERISLPKHNTWQPFDQLAASVILDPEIINTSLYSYITVETCGKYGRGAFFRDDRHIEKNVKLITKVNKSLFKGLLLNYMNNTSNGCIDVNQ